MEVSEAIDEYLITIKRLRPLTQARYAQRLEVFARYCDEHSIALEAVKNTTVDEFVEYVRAHHLSHHKAKPELSTYTLTGYVRVIKIFLAWCQDDEFYESAIKPATLRKIKLPKREQFIIETFTDAQIVALREVTENEFTEELRLRDTCILALLISTGLRADELCTLTLANVHLDPKQPYVKVHGKGNKWREIPLIDLSQVQGNQKHAPQIDFQARELLQRYKDRYRSHAANTETFFTGRYQCEPLAVNGLEKLIRRLGVWAEIQNVRCSPHTFRHTFAARFMIVFSDIYLLSKLMGHSDIKTTQEYLKSLSGVEVRLSLFRILNG